MKTELKPPQWLQISVILLFISNLVGIFAFVYDLILDPSTLDEIRQNFRANFPLWIKIACGLAVGLGEGTRVGAGVEEGVGTCDGLDYKAGGSVARLSICATCI